jgi:hypothetical protein
VAQYIVRAALPLQLTWRATGSGGAARGGLRRERGVRVCVSRSTSNDPVLLSLRRAGRRHHRRREEAQTDLPEIYVSYNIASLSLDRLGDDRRNAAAFWSSAHLCTLQPSKMAEAEAQVMEQIDIGHVLPTPLDTRRKFFVSEVHAAPRA